MTPNVLTNPKKKNCQKKLVQFNTMTFYTLYPCVLTNPKYRIGKKVGEQTCNDQAEYGVYLF